MIVVKVLALFILIAAIYCTKQGNKDFMNFYIKSVRCNASEKYIHNFSCFAKSFNRSFSGINIIGSTKMPINKMFVNAELLFKYGLIYREVIHTPKFDFCKLMDENDIMSNKIIGTTLKFINDSSPGAIHKCPYYGLNLSNAEVKIDALGSIFPTGDYKLIARVLDENDELIASSNVIATILSSEKNTFG